MRSSLRRAVLAFTALITLVGCIFTPPPADTNTPPEDVNTPPVQSPTDESLNNKAPTAKAGSNVTVFSGQTVTLSGATSSDPNADGLTYTWVQTAGPIVTFDSSAYASITRFSAPTVLRRTTLKFTLVVSDGFASDTDDVVVTVDPS